MGNKDSFFKLFVSSFNHFPPLDGNWRAYKNGQLVRNGLRFARNKRLTYGGRLILGQSASDPDTTNFASPGDCLLSDRNLCPRAFVGELSYLNFWSEPLNMSYILRMYQDCTFTYCGDAVEWVDFRSGTRGPIKLRWPSKIFRGDEGEHSGYDIRKYHP